MKAADAQRKAGGLAQDKFTTRLISTCNMYVPYLKYPSGRMMYLAHNSTFLCFGQFIVLPRISDQRYMQAGTN
jgi:hypothetical protein